MRETPPHSSSHAFACPPFAFSKRLGVLGGSSSSQKVLRYFLGALLVRGGVFSLAARYFRGTPLKNRAASPSSQKPFGKLREKAKSAVFAFSIILIKINARVKIAILMSAPCLRDSAQKRIYFCKNESAITALSSFYSMFAKFLHFPKIIFVSFSAIIS